MTDITELAQSLKAAAEKWQEAWGKYDKVEITIAEFIRAANQYESIVKDPANVLALVEALEKAQQRIDSQREYYEGVIADGGKRIADLESRTVKLPEPEQWDITQVLLCKKKVVAAIRAAGIKVEAE